MHNAGKGKYDAGIPVWRWITHLAFRQMMEQSWNSIYGRCYGDLCFCKSGADGLSGEKILCGQLVVAPIGIEECSLTDRRLPCKMSTGGTCTITESNGG